jgi:hypothetical protein
LAQKTATAPLLESGDLRLDRLAQAADRRLSAHRRLEPEIPPMFDLPLEVGEGRRDPPGREGQPNDEPHVGIDVEELGAPPAGRRGKTLLDDLLFGHQLTDERRDGRQIEVHEPGQVPAGDRPLAPDGVLEVGFAGGFLIHDPFAVPLPALVGSSRIYPEVPQSRLSCQDLYMNFVKYRGLLSVSRVTLK